MSPLAGCWQSEQIQGHAGWHQVQVSGFYHYLQLNWLPHKLLFAGFSHANVLHFDNHTNNRLEWYHHSIKSVTRSSQISVGLLIDRLHKLLCVHAMSRQQSDFNDRMRSKVYNERVVGGYRGKVSGFALEHIAYEHWAWQVEKYQAECDRAAGGTQAVVTYQCSASDCAYGAQLRFCRHIFIMRRQRRLDEVDLDLVALRWNLKSAVSTQGVSTHSRPNSGPNVVVCDLPVASSTS